MWWLQPREGCGFIICETAAAIVVANTKIWAPRTGIPKRSLVSSNVQGYFEELIDDAQDAILSMLGQRTLLQVLTELEIRESAKRTTSKVRLSVQNKR
ncbi:MAG: hypothetical protein WB607_29095 [Candidatus Acidiferrum sp.]